MKLTEHSTAGGKRANGTRNDVHRIRFELRPKNKTVTLRMSDDLLAAVKARAQQSGLDYQKFIRLTLERVVQRK